jgi:dTDP-4-amino-4,6-dideoxygalactose transaminase
MPRDYRRRGWASRDLVRSRLASLEESTAHRRRLAATYHQHLRAGGFFNQEVPAGCTSSWLRYPTLVEDRERILALAREKRIELGDWFDAPVHPASDQPEQFGYQPGECPRAELITQHIVNLPTHPRVTHEEADRILEFLLREAAPATAPAVPTPGSSGPPRGYDA